MDEFCIILSRYATSKICTGTRMLRQLNVHSGKILILLHVNVSIIFFKYVFLEGNNIF